MCFDPTKEELLAILRKADVEISELRKFMWSSHDAATSRKEGE